MGVMGMGAVSQIQTRVISWPVTTVSQVFVMLYFCCVSVIISILNHFFSYCYVTMWCDPIMQKNDKKMLVIHVFGILRYLDKPLGFYHTRGYGVFTGVVWQVTGMVCYILPMVWPVLCASDVKRTITYKCMYLCQEAGDIVVNVKYLRIASG